MYKYFLNFNNSLPIFFRVRKNGKQDVWKLEIK